MVCDFRPLKDEKFRFHIASSGDRLPYHQDSGSPEADLLETILILNSAASDPRKGARFMSLDVKYHFLATPMTDPKHVRVKHKHVPDDIKARCNID